VVDHRDKSKQVVERTKVDCIGRLERLLQQLRLSGSGYKCRGACAMVMGMCSNRERDTVPHFVRHVFRLLRTRDKKFVAIAALYNQSFSGGAKE